uniref:Uncharacterized protein n=1 Tax=Gloeochaete wittrockiana TaxID=38269 RepID=A0A3G1IVW4_9EUKA|nr:hypothetical protein [Gloeochaete wittrockiana]ASQ40196.1 hypothetical protein [Gloeochaete wittrockiana]
MLKLLGGVSRNCCMLKSLKKRIHFLYGPQTKAKLFKTTILDVRDSLLSVNIYE